MHEHTQYESFRDVASESHWQLEPESDLDAIPADKLDQYLAATTPFHSWETIRIRAATDNLLTHYAGTDVPTGSETE